MTVNSQEDERGHHDLELTYDGDALSCVWINQSCKGEAGLHVRNFPCHLYGGEDHVGYETDGEAHHRLLENQGRKWECLLRHRARHLNDGSQYQRYHERQPYLRVQWNPTGVQHRSSQEDRRHPGEDEHHALQLFNLPIQDRHLITSLSHPRQEVGGECSHHPQHPGTANQRGQRHHQDFRYKSESELLYLGRREQYADEQSRQQAGNEQRRDQHEACRYRTPSQFQGFHRRHDFTLIETRDQALHDQVPAIHQYEKHDLTG